ncbi:MAG: cytochrome c oxidase accessory protein CcoG [Alphaproteobacteria bacterium]|nr:cytochrome c oxidase accessory protein CcoG [Alphaproteobacteria bacterium]
MDVKHQGLAADGVSRLDVAAVNSATARALYKAREPIFPKRVSGRFRAVKWALLILTLGVYYGLPWLRWPRGAGEPSQAVLVDFEGGRFYFFFLEIWPQEIYFITGLLILAALTLFLVTALVGRVWCGYACPQTVWTDLFIAAERFVEGDRNARIRLDRAPWTAEKITKRGAKHAIWLLIAFATGGAWILYFHDAPTIARDFFTGDAPGSAYLFAGLLTFTTYSLAGLMREQVCTYMCPWPRIQGAMTDHETLEVTYRRDRGEPRGAHKKGEPWDGRGDCVDCRQCVAVCPMGIDIRDGDQLECINCALCIDACDEIMGKIGRPRGLIAYDSAVNAERRAQKLKPRFRPLRPRTIYYAAAWLIVAGVMLAGLATRTQAELSILRDRNPTYVVLSDGSVRNGYEVKILNKDNVARTFRLSVEAGVPLEVRVIGTGTSPDGSVALEARPDTVSPFRVFLTAPKEARTVPSLDVTFRVESAESGALATTKSVFQTGSRT